MADQTWKIHAWDDLNLRLKRAAKELRELRVMAAEHSDDLEWNRLANKVQGVELALDYMRGYGPL